MSAVTGCFSSQTHNYLVKVKVKFSLEWAMKAQRGGVEV
jgi:hypothetical protein